MAIKNQSTMTNDEIAVDMLNLTFSETWMMIIGRMFSNFIPDDVVQDFEEVKCYDCSNARTGNACPFKKKPIEAYKVRPFKKPVSVNPSFPTFPHGIEGSLDAEKSFTDRGTLRETMPVNFTTPSITVDWVKDDTPQKTLGNFLDNITETRKYVDPVDGSKIERDIVIGKLYAQDVEAEVQIDFWEYNPLTLELMTKLFRRYFVRKKNFTQCRLASRWRNVQLRSNGYYKEEIAAEPLKRASYKVSYVFEEIESHYNDIGSVESVASDIDHSETDEDFVTNNLRG